MTRLEALHLHETDRMAFDQRLQRTRDAILSRGGRLCDLKLAFLEPGEDSSCGDYRALLFYEIDADTQADGESGEGSVH